MRAKLSLNQIKQLETELSSRYTKSEVDAIISGVESNWNGQLNTLEAAVEQEILAIKGRLDTAESTLSAHTNSISSLGTQISDEASYRVAGDQTNAAAIAAEETRATAAEQAIAANLATEVSARQTADQALQTQIDTLNSEAGGSIGAIESRLDAVESKNTQQDLDIAAEQAARILGDNNLQTALNNEVTRATTAEGQLSGDLSALTNRVNVTENDINNLEIALDGEVTLRTSGDTMLDNKIVAEINRATAAEGQLDADITAVENRATSLETRTTAVELKNGEQDQRLTTAEGEIDALQSGLASEITRAQGVEGNLASLSITDNLGNPVNPTSLVGAIQSVYDTAKAAITEVEGVTDSLQDQIDSIVATNGNDDARLDAIESKDVEQDGRLTSVESKNTEQDGRLTSLEADFATLTNDSPVAELIDFGDTATAGQIPKWDGTKFVPVNDVSMYQQSFSATAGQTAFSLAAPVATVFIAMVTVNGVQYLLGSDFTMSGSSLTFTSGLEANDEVIATYFNK